MPPTPNSRSSRARSSTGASREPKGGHESASKDARSRSAPGKLASQARFYTRVARAAALSFAAIAGTLAIGTVGFMKFAGLQAIDAFHLASLLLSGMGPVGEVDKFSDSAKMFDSLYALFCGIVLLASVGVLLAPIVHRIMHRFHIEDAGD